MRFTVIATLLSLSLLCQTAVQAEDLLYDSFDTAVPGRWESVVGPEWKLEDGKFMAKPLSSDYEKSTMICDFPLTNGEIETTVHTVVHRSASFGIMGKYIDAKNWWGIRFAYWTVQLITNDKGYTLFPYTMRDAGGGEKPVRLRLVIIDDRVGFFADNTLITVFKDPLAGKAGRPGLMSESTSYSLEFKARRTR